MLLGLGTIQLSRRGRTSLALMHKMRIRRSVLEDGLKQDVKYLNQISETLPIKKRIRTNVTRSICSVLEDGLKKGKEAAMLAAGAKVAYEKDESIVWLCLVVIMSSAATMYQLYWDFVKDWGLLQINSNNPWLRNELMLQRKSIYYFSMVHTNYHSKTITYQNQTTKYHSLTPLLLGVHDKISKVENKYILKRNADKAIIQTKGLNLILRLAWLQTVLHSSFESVDYRILRLEEVAKETCEVTQNRPQHSPR
ncbi:hypothetical protein Lal_00013765 [Lupinus albus]|nr:hypothetical protein Lal_00013765 [Lupinus albus]